MAVYFSVEIKLEQIGVKLSFVNHYNKILY